MTLNNLITIAVLTLCSVVNQAVLSAPELKGNRDELSSYLLDERKIIVLEATAEEKVRADKASVTLIVKTKEDRFRRALEKNKQIRERVKQALVSGGIKPDAIRFSDYSNAPSYGWFGDKPSSYEVANEMKIDIDNEGDMLIIADSIDTVKELFFVRLLFEHTDKQQSEQAALKKALAVVNAKRKILEDGLAVKLSVVRFQENVYTEDGVVVAKPRGKMLSSAVESYAEKSSEADSTGFGELVYRANIRVEYTQSVK